MHSDPTDEDAYCVAMRIAGLLGRSGEARDLYAQCVEQLDIQLGVEPARTTVELFRSVVDSHPGLVEADSATRLSPLGENPIAPFVGREGERVACLEQVDRLMEGVGGVLMVDGEAGAGKSRLIAEVLDGARWRGATVLEGTQRSSRGLQPFSGLVQALGPTVSGLRGEHLGEVVEAEWIDAASEIFRLDARDRPEFGSGASGQRTLRAIADVSNEVRWHRCEALVQVLVGQGRVGPTVVVLDDVQWIDDDSVEVLVEAARRLAEARVLLVLSFRRDEAMRNRRLWSALRSLEASNAQRISVGELASEEARVLAGWAGSKSLADDGVVDEVVDAVGGNPLYLIETARAVAERGAESTRAVPVPSSVSEVIAQRVSHLDAHVVTVLATLAVADCQLSIGQLESLMAISRSEILHALTAAVDAGFIIEDDDVLGFGHELVRRGIYTSVPVSTRRDLHGRVGEFFESAGTGSVEELAAHAARAGRWSEAYHHYRHAADQALAVGAFRTSHQHFARARRAHARAELDAASLTELLLDYEVVLDLLSERRRQQAVLASLAKLAGDERTMIEVVRRRAALAGATGDFDEAVAAARNGVERADEAGVLEAETYAGLGWMLIGAGRAHDAIEALEHATSIADSPVVEADAHCALGRALTMVHDFAGAEKHLRQALTISDSEGNRRGEIDALGSLGVLAIESGDRATAEADLQRAITMADAAGYRRGAAVNLVNLASMFAMSGRSGDSLLRYDAALERFRVVREARGEAMVLANRAAIRLRIEGELATTASDVRRAYRYFVGIGDERHQAMCLDTLANIHRRARKVASARRLLGRAEELAERADDAWFGVQIRRSMAMLELDAGRPLVALDAIQAARSTAKQYEFDGVMPSLLVIEARVMQARDQTATALDLAQSAASMLTDHSDLAPYVALWSAQVLEACGAPSTAISALAISADRLLEPELAGLDEQRRARAMSSSADHVAIDELVQRFVPSTALVELPRAGHGSSVSEPAGVAHVRLTVAHPDDHRIADGSERRRARLLRLAVEAADAGCAPRVVDFASLLGVSASTVKRDLAALRDVGHNAVTANPAP